MLERNVTIVNRLGLHARAATKLVNVAQAYGARVTLARDDEEIDCKSIMSVLLLAASQGTELTLRADGEDAEDAMAAVVALIDDKFGEGE